MKPRSTSSWLPVLLVFVPVAASTQQPGSGDLAALRARWNEPIAPFRVAGDTWYVGPRGLTVLAIRTSAGVILLDAALPESVPQILEHLGALGIAPGDVRLLLSSHAHFDHAGGFAALKDRTGAELVATRDSAALLAAGGRGDLHYGDAMPFPRAQVDRFIAHGDTVTLGQHTLTAWQTAGHTPGSTTWTWSEHVDGGSLAVVYADSLTAPGYQLVGHPEYPRIVTDFEASAVRIASLPCDVLVTPHPAASDLDSRRAQRAAPGAPLLSPGGCARYADRARVTLERQVAEQSRAVGRRDESRDAAR